MENMMAYPRFDDRPSTEIWHSRIFRESSLFNKYEKLPSSCSIALGDFLSVRDTEKHSGNPRGDTIWIAQLTSIYEDARTETLQKSGGLPVIKFEVPPLYERFHVLRVSKSILRPQGTESSESSCHILDINGLRSVRGKLSEVERDIRARLDRLNQSESESSFIRSESECDSGSANNDSDINDSTDEISQDLESYGSQNLESDVHSTDSEGIRDLESESEPELQSDVRVAEANRSRPEVEEDIKQGIKQAVMESSKEHRMVFEAFEAMPKSLRRYELFYTDKILHGFTEADIIDHRFIGKINESGYETFDPNRHEYFINSKVKVSVKQEIIDEGTHIRRNKMKDNILKKLRLTERNPDEFDVNDPELETDVRAATVAVPVTDGDHSLSLIHNYEDEDLRAD